LSTRRAHHTVLQVAQTIAVIISLTEREGDQDVVTLSTLQAAKGLEWPHVVLADINEGLLPFHSAVEGAEAAVDNKAVARAAGVPPVH
jgi:ATP-dependent DNA helicase Rep